MRKNSAKAETQIVELTKAYIDKYADLSEAIKKLEEEREKIRQTLINLGIGSFSGNKHEILIEEIEQEVFDPLKVADLLKKKDFCSVVRVVNEKVKKLIPAHLLKGCIKERKKIIKIKVIK